MPETLEEALKEIAEWKAKYEEKSHNFDGFRTVAKEKEALLKKELETKTEELTKQLTERTTEYDTYKKDVE